MNDGYNNKNILKIFEAHFVKEIKYLLEDKFWESPRILQEKIQNILESKSEFLTFKKLLLTGETTNFSLYVLRNKDIILYTPFEEFKNNLIMEYSPNIIDYEGSNLCLLKKDTEILLKLQLPNVLLINPSVKEVFPVPRLAICIASLAGYLRKYQKGNVHILDMQLDQSMDNIISEIMDIQPEIIGISISFGQANLAEEILDIIFTNKKIMDKKPIIVAGNIIAAFGYDKWLEKFPNLIICNGEGELTLSEIVNYSAGLTSLSDVPGITYLENGMIKKTKSTDVAMNTLPLPAMDTVEGIFTQEGVLTMEISRGCSHSACIFCPRTHKSKKWKEVSADNVIDQLKFYSKLFDIFGVNRRIFMADEEFIGWINDHSEVKRITDICNGIIKNDYNIKFETNTRVDQIFKINNDKSWHIDRMQMLTKCKEAGLERLLLGVESGSNSVLKRFNKGIDLTESIMAIRILTALGIGLRATFIMFDPLMNISELKDNILFLERKDIYLNEVDLTSISYSDLYDGVQDDEFIDTHSKNTPLYENIAYMLVLLEVLMNCHYVDLLREDKKELLDNNVDVNMVRHKVLYSDDLIGDISNYCQRWVDRHFALDYCLKGMYKIANYPMRNEIMKYRIKYREISFYLLKSLVYVFDKDDSMTIDNDIISNKTLSNFSNKSDTVDRIEVIIEILNYFNEKLNLILIQIEKSILNGSITDTNKNLLNIIIKWRDKIKWELINQ